MTGLTNGVDYSIQYSTDGGVSWTLYPHNPSAATRIIVGGLANGIEHVFRVATVNVMGAGAYSAVSGTVVPVALVTVPSAPTSMKIQAGIGQATLTWSEPTSNGSSAITSYEISYSSDDKQTWSAPLSVPATSPTAVIANLSNGVNYFGHVLAVNAAGRGSATIGSVTPTNPAAQAAVRFLKAGTLSVTIQFGYTIRGADGNRQAKFLTLNIGSLDRSGEIKVPDFDRVDRTVTGNVTVRILPRGTTKGQSFSLQKKTHYSIGISYDKRDTDPWSATTIRCG
ncbi:MAG: fibronectin type III domain-containing protein [Candidatus Kapaibacterium sp.]